MGEQDFESFESQKTEQTEEKQDDLTLERSETSNESDASQIADTDLPTCPDSNNRRKDATHDRPRHFYCPLTKEIFKNPVVAPNGETYDKSAYLEEHGIPQDCETVANLYPNRALKMVMDDDNLAHSNSIQASFRKLAYSIKRAMSEYLEELEDIPENSTQRGNSDVSLPLSDGYYCCITYNIMHEPLIDPDGNTYEKVAIENWIRIHGDSPITRRQLTKHCLYPNRIIEELLEMEKNKPPNEIHTDILKWKDEPRPEATDVEYGGRSTAWSPTQRLSAEQLRLYRRRSNTRQFFRNTLGILACLLILKFVPC